MRNTASVSHVSCARPWKGWPLIIFNFKPLYYVCKRLEISSAHALHLTYESKCEELHGHNWIVKVYCKSETLNADGMVTDFTHIKRDIGGMLDHKNLNEVLPFNPTAENIARWICDHVENAYRVEVWESEMNMAAYER